MRIRRTFVFALLTLLPVIATAQDAEVFVGNWHGGVVRDGSVQIMYMRVEAGSSGLEIFCSTPDLEIGDLKAWNVSSEGGILRFGTIYGAAEVRHVTETDDLVGKAVHQRRGTFQIHLRRYQPDPVRGFSSKEITVNSGDITIAAELLIPDGEGPHPAILFFHGRSNGSRELFREIGKRFALRGVAGVIFDRQGTGASGGDADTMVFSDLVNDGIAVFEAVHRMPEIDEERFGLYGQSAGGWIMPEVAVRAGAAFVVGNVAPSESVWEQQKHVSMALMKLSGEYSEEEIEAAGEHMEAVQLFSHTGEGWEELQQSNEVAKAARWAEIVDIPETKDNSEIDWVNRFKSDPAPWLMQLNAPALYFYGEKDYVVPPEYNEPKLREYLETAGNTDFEIVIYPEVGHGLSLSGGERDVNGEKRYLPGRVYPGYYEKFYSWVLERVGLAQ